MSSSFQPEFIFFISCWNIFEGKFYNELQKYSNVYYYIAKKFKEVVSLGRTV